MTATTPITSLYTEEPPESTVKSESAMQLVMYRQLVAVVCMTCSLREAKGLKTSCRAATALNITVTRRAE
jgi:hypothetical protein